MKKIPLVISVVSALSVNGAYAQQTIDSDIWQPFEASALSAKRALNSQAAKKQTFHLDLNRIEQTLLEQDSVMLKLPLPNGEFRTFKLEASRVMAPELASKYPSIRTFSGYEVNAPKNKGRFDITPHGFHAVFNIGSDKVFIDPMYRESRDEYQSYFQRDAKPLSSASKRMAPRVKQHLEQYKSRDAKSADDSKITYRIAVTNTGEYADFHGGTKEKTLAAIVTMLNRVNEVYQRDLDVTLELVANNDDILFTDASSDPFDNTDNDIDKTTQVINDAIGQDNYDIGHIVGTGGGGLAGLGVVCSNSKAEGVTGSDSPTNDSFYIDYVAHEIGHQFGAEHTFNGESEACGGGNREGSSAYEPGSASSIMGYAGICGAQNIQTHSDPYFHIHSIDQMRAFIQTGEGANCGTRVAKTNQAPLVDAGKDYTIPANTPFTLVGSATDTDSDVLSYSWEQFDLGAASTTKQDDQTDDGQRPLFRMFEPTSVPTRTLPQLSDILAGTSSFGETLPTTSRDLNFRFVVRDNNGNLVDDAMKVTVIANIQGFATTAPGKGEVWQEGQQVVTWNTADSDKAPVSCSNVDIMLSTDSGSTFDKTLATQVPNTGSATVSLADMTTTTGRIKVSCSDNIFFSITPADFTIAGKGEEVVTLPIFRSHKPLIVDEDGVLTISMDDLVFDKEVDSIALQQGDNYRLDGLTVTPDANFNGTLSITGTATRAELTSEPFSLTVVVNAVNDAPEAQDDSESLNAANSRRIVVDVLENDSDIDGDSLTIESITYNGDGIVKISNGKISYTVASGFSGTDFVSYTISDGNGGTDTAELRIAVKGQDNDGASNLFGGSQGPWTLTLLAGLLIARRRGVKA